MPRGNVNEPGVLDVDGKVLPAQLLSRDETTYHLLIQAKDVPSLGYKVLGVVPETRHIASDLQATGLTMENSLLHIQVDSTTGCISSLYEKETHFESIASGECGNQLQLFVDKPQEYDAWNIDPGTLDHFTPIAQADSVQLVETGPLRSTIRVTRHWGDSKVHATDPSCMPVCRTLTSSTMSIGTRRTCC